MDGNGFRVTAHTADVGIEARGRDLGDMFVRAVEGLFHVIGNPVAGESVPAWEIAAEGVDREDLLVRVLTEALARFELEGLHVTRADSLGATDTSACLRCEGVRIDHDREPGLQEVKAITYHDLRVEDVDGGLQGRVVLDL